MTSLRASDTVVEYDALKNLDHGSDPVLWRLLMMCWVVWWEWGKEFSYGQWDFHGAAVLLQAANSRFHLFLRVHVRNFEEREWYKIGKKKKN